MMSFAVGAGDEQVESIRNDDNGQLRRRKRSKSLPINTVEDDRDQRTNQNNVLFSNGQTALPGSTGPGDCLRELSVGKSQSPLLFCELQELHDGEWHEKARWVKFEEDVDEGSGRWSKPFVASMPMAAVFELRRCLSQCVVQFDVEVQSYRELVELTVNALIVNNHLKSSLRQNFIATLLSKHVHQHENARGQIKRGLSEIGKKLSSRKMIDEPSTISSPASFPEEALTGKKDARKPNENLAKKLSSRTEAASTMVGAVDYLDKTIAAFFRLSNAIVLDELSEVPVPNRFVFLLLGPSSRAKNVPLIGRAMSTVMSDEIFRNVAYRARHRNDLLAGLDRFINEVTILPPGEWDPTIRIQPPSSVLTQEERMASSLALIAEERFESNKNGDQVKVDSADLTNGHIDEAGDDDLEMDPALQRTGRIFGGLVEDIKRKLPWYRSEFTDAFNFQCLAAVFFMFFANLSPTITFGGLLGLATENNMAAFETILSGAICGTIYHLFAGQPITILGSTGPVLVFEKILYSFAKDQNFSYLTLRFWIGIWTAVFFMLVVAFDLSALVALITRFTEECFATLISVIFIYEAFVAIYGIYQDNPISNVHNLARNYSCWCDEANDQAFFSSINISTNSSVASNCTAFDLKKCWNTPQCQPFGPGCELSKPVPDVFLFSCLIFLGTCGLTFALKNFRTSSFFPNKVRSGISDFAVTISIFVMVAVDFLVALPTPKLEVPQEFAPTKPERAWIVDPFTNPVWTIFASLFPASLLAVLLFMDQQIPAVIVNRPENKIQKGKGYHLDMLVLTLLVAICASFGLPYFVAATVPTISHITCLRKLSETSAPGEQPKFLGLIEQRVTGFLVFALIGCSIPLREMLKFIPMPVLYGVFLYMGLSALQTSEFYHRFLLIFMPTKYQPDAPYLRHMQTWRVHLFTLIELTCFVFLWVIKEIKQISILFILMLVVMVVVRKLLDFVFTEDELRWIDDVLPKNPLAVHNKGTKKSSKTIIEAGDNAKVARSLFEKNNLRSRRGNQLKEPESVPLQNQSIVEVEHL